MNGENKILSALLGMGVGYLLEIDSEKKIIRKEHFAFICLMIQY